MQATDRYTLLEKGVATPDPAAVRSTDLQHVHGQPVSKNQNVMVVLL